jgi:hypothetical protein
LYHEERRGEERRGEERRGEKIRGEERRGEERIGDLTNFDVGLNSLTQTDIQPVPIHNYIRR